MKKRSICPICHRREAKFFQSAIVEESRQKLFVQLFVMATVVSLSLILTVYIASTYYKDVADLSFWTPVPSETATDTLVPTTQAVGSPTPTLTPTLPEPTVAKNCTYSALYWFYHPEAWPPQIVVGSLTYTKEEAFSILQNPNPDSAGKLFIQLHAAILNYLAGADFDVVRQTTIDASEWLNDHPFGAAVSEAEAQASQALTKALEDYNNGLVGPGRCADEPALKMPTITPTPVDTPTPTETATETPAPTRQFIPSNTPRRTRVPPTRPPTNTPVPTQLPPPTQPPPTQPPPPPTPVP